MAPLFCDLYDKTENTIVEEKGSVARPAIAMAVGKLAEYARLVITPTPRKVLLIFQKPAG